MTTTTATMTFSPPARLRVSDSTPPFLLQQRHGPPAYFLHRMPPSTVPLSPAPSSHVKHKRSFPVATLSAKPGLAETTPSTNKSQPRLQTSNSSANPDAPPTRRKASASPRLLPVPAPPPEKALPPIPFPSPPSSTAINLRASAQSLLLACPPLAPPLRPVSEDAEETICQLERLAAELRQMGSGSLAATNERRSRQSAPAQRRRRELPGKSAAAAAGSRGKAGLSVPRIVVTNPSTENLFGAAERETAGARTAESDGDSGDVTEEELWVNEYGGWGTSEKGKWKAAGPEEDERCAEPASSSSPHVPRSRTKPAEMFYIYEPIGAPEFLIGSSTSPVARATAGFHSRGAPAPAPSVSQQQCSSVRRRRRRPAALVLANPEQAEWVAEPAAPKSAPLLARPAHAHAPSPPVMYRSLTAPQSSPASTNGFPSHLPPGRALSSDIVQAGGDMAADIRYAVPPSGRRSAPLGMGGALPRVPSAHALRDEPEGGHARQAPSWDALALAPGPASEPNSPRLASRPRLKSIKGLFKHFSK